MLSYKRLRNKTTSNVMSYLRNLECPDIQILSENKHCFIGGKVAVIFLHYYRHTSLLQLLLFEVKQNTFYFSSALDRKSSRKINYPFVLIWSIWEFPWYVITSLLTEQKCSSSERIPISCLHLLKKLLFSLKQNQCIQSIISFSQVKDIKTNKTMLTSKCVL